MSSDKGETVYCEARTWQLFTETGDSMSPRYQIRYFAETCAIPKGWVGLDSLKPGKIIELLGLKFKVRESQIVEGKPGSVTLKLEAMAKDVEKSIFEQVINPPKCKNFIDVAKLEEYDDD